MGGLPELLRINYEAGWNCQFDCAGCYRFLDCSHPARYEIFRNRSRVKQIKQKMAGIGYKIAIMSGKGGVGKSTVTVNLALGLAFSGESVAILDIDFEGPSIPNLLGIDSVRLKLGEDGIEPVTGPGEIKVISTGLMLDDEQFLTWFQQSRKEVIEEFLADVNYGLLDYLLIDLPPGTGTETLNVIRYLPDLDGVIIVTAPSEVSSEVVRKTAGLCQKAGVPVLGVIENLSGFTCSQCGTWSKIFSFDGGKLLATETGVPFLGRIPVDYRASYKITCIHDSFLYDAPETEISKAYGLITRKIKAKFDKRLSAQEMQEVADKPLQEQTEILELAFGKICDQRCHDCSDYLECSRPIKVTMAGMGQTTPALYSQMSNIRYKIAVLSGKGGVGKSTVSVNLALSLAQKGFKTAILDSDFHGPSIPKMLGVQGGRLKLGPSGIIPVSGPFDLKVISLGFLIEKEEAVTWFQELKRSAVEQFLALVDYGALDFLLIDLPAGTGSETVNLLRILPDLDGVIVVTSPSYLAQAVARRAISLVRKARTSILGMVENMGTFVCPKCQQKHKLFFSDGGSLAEKAGVNFLASLPAEEAVAIAADQGIPLGLLFPHSVARQEFDTLAERVLSILMGNV